MPLALALLEGVSLFIIVCAMSFLWDHSILIGWLDIATVLGQGLAISLCCIVSFYYNDLYDLRIVRSLREFAPRLLRSFGVALILLVVLYLLFPRTQIGGWPLISSLLIIIGFILSLRAVCYGVMRRHLLAERVLILGTSPLARKIAEEIESAPHLRYTILGGADNAMTSCETILRYPLLGPLEGLPKIVEEIRPERIVVALANGWEQLPVDHLLQSRVNGVAIEDGVEFYERLTGKLAETLPPGNLIFSQNFRKLHRKRAVRRTMSLVASMLGLIGLAPLFALIALAIKLDSDGPVFFIQPRLGLRGRRFNLIKFRTMRPSNGATSEWARDNSDRITRVGTWLRKFRLDELPQFINILRGDMSFVGPRPHPVSNYQLFAENIPFYSLRSMVRPGMTGWAQIRYGYANNLQEEMEKMRYDLYYIRHMSFWFDLRILFDTVKIVLFGRGAVNACRLRRHEGEQALSQARRSKSH